MLNKTIIARNFSKSAGRYDEYADIQRFAAENLIKEIPLHEFESVLELGCGTGIYTQLLKDRLKKCAIRAIDISEEMVEVARKKIRDERVVFEMADAEKISSGEDYDLITSSSTVQWFTSMEKTLEGYADILKKGAWLIFSSFGPRTFIELAESLNKAQGGRNFSIASGNFLNKQELEELLAKYFNKVSVKEVLTQEEYPSLEVLLKKIKYTGTGGCESGCGFFWNKGLLRAVEEAYINNKRRIVATYQIYLCKAEK